MRFADYAKIYVTSGNGGAGSSHFRREKFVPKGGPDGGDGGRGGHVIIKGNKQLNTILDLRYRKFIKAEHGQGGMGAKKHGRNGKDTILEVPLGTVAYEAETKKRIGEITKHEELLILASGGRGGLGNWHFRSATKQSPEYAQPGEEGEEKIIELELKLMADVGLVGFPNAGKSTLLSALSAAKPKIADYPFTTLEPNLGVVQLEGYRSFVMADIPGIIEDAHKGKGLGLQFLRHIERNNLLLFVVSSFSDVAYEYQALVEELNAYRADLLEKPRLLAVTKLDAQPDFDMAELESLNVPIIGISSVAGMNLVELKEKIWQEIAKLRED
jgi:GTP-binding protein